MIIGPRIGELQRIIAGLSPFQSGIHAASSAATSAVVTWLSAMSAATDIARDQIAVALCASLVSAYRLFVATATGTFTKTSFSSAHIPLQHQSTPSVDDITIGSTVSGSETPAQSQHSYRKSFFAK